MRIVSGLASGQVLQRVKNAAAAAVEGECAAAGPVVARLTAKGKPLPRWKDLKVGSAAGGRFTVQLKGIPTGGPYKLTLTVGKASVQIDELFVGDVWLMAGQSNMQGIGNLAGAPKPHPLVRCLHMDGAWRRAEDPLHLLSISPDAVHSGGSPKTYAEARKEALKGGKGVGVGVFFALEMLKRTRGVPQGLIATAHGGTSMAQWDPLKKTEGGNSLYYSMLSLWSKTGQPVSGVLWYQGESDCSETASRIYTEKMQAFVAALRADLRLPKLPFLLVQIGRYTVAGPDSGRWWEAIREYERLLPRSIPNLAVVPAIDLPLDDAIHVGSDGLAELAKRLARPAARLALGDKKERPEPEPLAAEVIAGPTLRGTRSNLVRVRFKNLVGGLRSQGLPSGFALLDMDGAIRQSYFRVNLEKDAAVIYCEPNTINNAAAVLYGPGVNPHCNLYDGRGAALPAFGPLYFGKGLRAITPFLPACDATALQPLPADGVASMPFPARDAFPAHRVSSGPSNGFMSEHARWEGKPGWAAFHFAFECAEAMPLKLLLGYDGPFRFAVDGEERFRDLNGTNPAVADTKNVETILNAGRHEACVLMDTNGGKAWGFWFRIHRTDIGSERVPKRDYALPVFTS
ncbi:MAG: sialate O-acetylesterase [Planctomycetes bacterium]|nr:sialate O-acetylesterase [Planctomycetota bacterium]